MAEPPSSFASPHLSYSYSGELSMVQKDPPPPPSQLKAEISQLLSLDEDDNEASSLLKGISPQQQRENVQDLLHYIDNMTFSPYTKNNKNHSLYLEGQESIMAKKSLSFRSAEPTSSRLLRDSTNKNTPAVERKQLQKPFPLEMTPIQPLTSRSPTLAYQSFSLKEKQDPVGSSPKKATENHIHQESFFQIQKEEPNGNSPLKSKEAHLFENSRYVHYDSDDDEESQPSRVMLPSYPSLRQALQDPPLEKSMEDAWSVVLGSTICEEQDDEQEQQQHPTTPIQRSLNELPDSVKSPEDAKLLLKTAVTTLQDARAERENARQFAQNMKAAVSEWVQEQRTLLRSESNISEDHTQRLTKLDLSIERLFSILVDSNQQRSQKEDTLLKLLKSQQETIQALGNELTDMKLLLNTKDTPQQTNRRRGGTPKSCSSTSSGRVKKQLKNGGHVVLYASGVQKEVHPDGTVVVRFNNGDVETKFPNGTCAYFHSSEKVMQITQRNGSTLYEYPNRQIERHYADGQKAILFPDGTKQRISASGKVETTFA